MNSFKVADIKANSYFTDDVSIDNTFLLLPKKKEVTQSILTALMEWQFYDVYSKGELVSVESNEPQNFFVASERTNTSSTSTENSSVQVTEELSFFEAMDEAGSITLYATWIGRTDIAYTLYFLMRDLTVETEVDATITEGTENYVDLAVGDTVRYGDYTYTVHAREPHNDALVDDAVENYLRRYNYAGYQYETYEFKGDTVGQDGTTGIYAFYTRQAYTLRLGFEGNGISAVSASGTGVTVGNNGAYNVLYGATVTITANLKPGYSFDAWTNQAGYTEVTTGEIQTSEGAVTTERTATTTFTMPDTTLGVYLVASANAENVTYYVEHYQQNADDDNYTIVGTRTPETALTDSSINIEKLKSVAQGFEFDRYTTSTITNSAETDNGSLVVSGTGDLLIKLYYNRLTYTVSLTAGTGIASVSLTAYDSTHTGNTYNVRFGGTVTLSATERAGYTFRDWTVDSGSVTLSSATNPNATFTMPYENVVLTANATANNDTAYQVNYYVQKADGSFVLDNNIEFDYPITSHTAGKTGTTDTSAPINTLSAITYTGLRYSYYTAISTTNGNTGEDDEALLNGSLNIDGDGSLVVNLYYVRETYTLTLNTSKGVASVGVTLKDGITKSDDNENTYNVMYNVSVDLTYTLTNKVGYHFAGWTVNSGNITVSGNNFTMPTNAVVLTATATAQQFNVILNGNGGLTESGQPTVTVSATFESDVILPENPFELEGYTFNGWATEENGEVVYGDEETIPFNQITDMTLWAVWGENQYTITYNSNGGQGTMGSTQAVYDTAVELPENGFTRTGWTWTGWSIDGIIAAQTVATVEDITTSGVYYVTSEGKYYAFNLTDAGSATVYAMWSENSYTLTLDGNNASGRYQGSAVLMADKSATQTLRYSQNANLEEIYTRTGYTFVSWNTEANGTGTTYLSTETPSMLSADVNGQVTLYAIWTADTVKYTVKIYEQNVDAADDRNDTNYRLVGGQGTEYDALTGATVNVSTYATARTGFEYSGFTTNVGQNSLVVQYDGSLTISLWYTRNAYDVTVNAAGDNNGIASVSGSATDVDYGKSVTVSATVNAGYTFVGFTSNNTALIPSVTREQCTLAGNTYSYTFNMPAGDVVLTASATANTNTSFNIVYLFEELGQDGVYTENDEYSNTFAKTGRGTTDRAVTRDMIETANGGTMPTVSGFTFVNFGILQENGEGSEDDPFTSVIINGNGTSTVYVYYARLSYRLVINYYYNGTSNSIRPSIDETYEFGARYFHESPQVTGYRIETGKETISGTMSNADVTETVYYTAIEYTLTYDLNGGAFEGEVENPTTFTIEDAITLPEPQLTGWRFRYWEVSVVDEENETSFVIGQQFTDTINAGVYGNVTLRAIWGAETNVVTYHLTNATKVSGPDEIDSGDDFSATITANTGYTLPDTITVSVNGTALVNSEDDVQYTYSQADGTITIDGDLINGDVVITVTATANHYNAIINTTHTTVSLDENGDYTTSITQDVATGTTITVYAKADLGYGASGIAFVVTAGRADVSAVSHDEETGVYYVTVSNYTDTFTIMATATINSYTLTINPNGGSYDGKTENTTITKNFGETIDIVAPTYLGYIFDEWTESEEEFGTLSRVGQTDNFTYTFGAGNETITAQWHADRFKVTIDLNDVTVGNGDTTATESLENVTITDGKIEDELLSMVETEKNVEKLLEKDSRWAVLYHLSPVRKNILEWYPFKEDGEILEIGAGGSEKFCIQG